MKDLITVIPVYNEEEVIEKVLQDWLSVFKGLNINFEIHVYNDGSTDKTQDILNNFKEIIVHHNKNKGHGPTLTQAYKENINKSEWLFQADSDDEITPKNFEEFWNKRNQADILVGRRDSKNKSFIRLFITSVASLLVKLLFGAGINDTNVPFRLFRSARFDKFILSLPEQTLVPNILFSAYACSNSYKIIEIPVEYNLRQTGISSIKGLKLFQTAIKASTQVVAYRLRGF